MTNPERKGKGRKPRYAVGDHVVYRMPKVSTHPGPRAEGVRPATHGEDYAYAVDKYWIVSGVLDEDTVEIRTRRGKTRRLKVDDPNLRKANVIEELTRRGRFPKPGDEGTG